MKAQVGTQLLPVPTANQKEKLGIEGRVQTPDQGTPLHSFCPGVLGQVKPGGRVKGLLQGWLLPNR